MKKSGKNILIGLSIVGFCAFGAMGAALLSQENNSFIAIAENGEVALSSSTFLYKGAAVRVIGDEVTSGVRFKYAVRKDVYEEVLASDKTAKTYVALSPLSLLNGVQLDKDNAQKTIEITDFWTEQEIEGVTYMQAIASVYDIPKDYYAAKIATIAYAEIDGETIYSECENNNAIAMADVALYETNNINSALSTSQLKALKDDYLTYSLTLHDPDRTVSAAPSQIVYGEKVEIADGAHRKGYKFDGWYNYDYTKQWINGTTSVLGNTALYARYTETIELKSVYDVYIKGQTIGIVEAYYGDGTRGVSCEVFDGEGNRVVVENGKFIAQSAGVYKAVYTCGTDRLEQSINVIGDVSDGSLCWTESLKNSLIKSLDGKGNGGENGAYPANVSLIEEKGKNALKVQYNENFPGSASDSSTYDKSSYPGIEIGELIDSAVKLTSSSVVSFYVKLSDGFWGQKTGGIFITYNGVNCSTMSSDNGKYGINSFVSRISAEIDGTGEFIKSSTDGNLLWTERSVCGVSGKAYLMQLAMDGAKYDSPQWVKVTLKFNGISNPSLKGLRILYSSRNGVMYNRSTSGSMLAEITAKDAIYISDIEIAGK